MNVIHERSPAKAYTCSRRQRTITRVFRGTLASRNLPEMSPDYLVYSAADMTVQVGKTLLDQRTVLAGGFFDENWQ